MTILFCALSANAGGGVNSTYTSQGGYFSITVPPGWTPAPAGGEPAAAKKIYGVDLLGTAAGGAPAPSITVKFYAKGNTLFKSPEDYLRLNSAPLGEPEEGEQYSDVTTTGVGGEKTYLFERKHTEYNKPRTVPPGKTVIFERHLVIPAGEGFYLLMFSVPFRSAKALLPQFETVVKSFRSKYR